jgi:Holliday junction DNA helicase RuvA
MIGHLNGRLIAKQPPHLVVEAAGVGYEVEAPMSTFVLLPGLGETLLLHTHLVVREDAQLLYGFATMAEKQLFRELIKVSGVGPRVALAVLSGMSAGDFWSTVEIGNAALLQRLPGVGKKTAERLIVEMRDKASQGGTTASPGLASAAGGAVSEARAALAALGYKPGEIQRLVDGVATDGMSTEQIVQAALRQALR